MPVSEPFPLGRYKTHVSVLPIQKQTGGSKTQVTSHRSLVAGHCFNFWKVTKTLNLANPSFTCRSSCPLLFHLFSFLTLIVINISPGKKTTYISILTNILFLLRYRVLKFGMTFLSYFVIHLLFQKHELRDYFQSL